MPLEENQQEESRRDQLSELFEAAEAGEDITTAAPTERARDEGGRFAPKAADSAETPTPTPVEGAAPAVTAPPTPTPAPVAAPAPAPAVAEAPQLTTWKKEFIPLQQKLSAGQSLTAEEAQRLAAYNVQREREYSTGISSYKAEVQAGKPVMDALQEFMPALRGANMPPEQWIQNVGRAHSALVFGNPEQKLNVLASLMQGYGISPQAFVGFLQGEPDQAAMAAMHQAYAGSKQNYEVQQLQLRAQQAEQQLQQQQDQEAQQQLAKFADTTKYPHFEQVRGEMAQILETGFAQDLDDAYDKAVRLNTEAWTAEQGRQAAAAATAQQHQRTAAVTKAKAASGQVRTAAPSSTATAPVSAKDRRAALSASFDAIDAGRV